MKQEIRAFVEAQEALRKAEAALNAKVQVRLNAAKDDEDQLQALIDELPKGYRGTRRLYQRIAELEISRQERTA